jgi:hypothetical protein
MTCTTRRLGEWQPGDRVPWAARSHDRPALIDVIDHGTDCDGEDGSCPHEPYGGVPGRIYQWSPGDPIARFDTPTEPAVTRLEQPAGGPSPHRRGR